MAHEVIVIGAGAGGMMAAGRAAECGARVILLEKMPGGGNKLLLTGQRRCNVTNAREMAGFIEMYGPNGRFLYPAFKRFFRDDLLGFLGRHGVATRIEKDGKIFPVSGGARSVLNAMERYAGNNGVRLLTNTKVTAIKTDRGGAVGVASLKGDFAAQAVVLASGGASYPGTGSSGDGYRMAAALGHTIVPLRPALVPVLVNEAELAGTMQGVSLRNVRLTAYRLPPDRIDPSIPVTHCGRGTGRKARPPVVESRTGDVLFTHFGLSGPIVLQMSLSIYDSLRAGPVSVSIDLRPDKDFAGLDAEIRGRLELHGKRSFRSILAGLLPDKMVPAYLDLTGIPPDRPAHRITGAERERLTTALKSMRFGVKGTLPISAAMVTAGGVSLKEINPRTMASKLVQGLFFCGEILDIDADTGGFNLQAAFSTGYAAGEEAAAFARGPDKVRAGSPQNASILAPGRSGADRQH